MTIDHDHCIGDNAGSACAAMVSLIWFGSSLNSLRAIGADAGQGRCPSTTRGGENFAA
jgi:hypothetical protein